MCLMLSFAGRSRLGVTSVGVTNRESVSWHTMRKKLLRVREVLTNHTSSSYLDYYHRSTVDDFVAANAPDFNKIQQTSTSQPQQVQQQSLGSHKILQISIRSGIWFGTRGSEVQILPDQLFPTTYAGRERDRNRSAWFWPRCSSVPTGINSSLHAH